jgi:hypothetical protein
MTYLCGRWVGSGKAEGTSVSEELDVTWSADRRSLVATTRATSGDRFVATTQVAYSPADGGTFTAIESNNGRWPERRFKGKLDGDTLHFHEVAKDRRVRLSLSRLPDHSLVITEARARGAEWEAPFVSIKYVRATSEARCAA